MPRLPWPLPALLAWALAWAVFMASAQFMPVGGAVLLACAFPVLLSPLAQGWWRRVLLAAGFPLALICSGAAGLPGWLWLAPPALLLLVYPLGAWRDAPLFPTPRGALAQLASYAPLAPGARVLDAGCGLGDGLLALREVFPQAHFEGLERSRLLQCVCAVRCPWARVRQGDIWKAHWSRYELVYLFQRPESMARAYQKAHADMAPGSCLVSLEFVVPGIAPDAEMWLSDKRSVWLYRISGRAKTHRSVLD